MVEVAPTIWQLVKRYAIGGFEHIHTITKPVAVTVAVKIGGVPATLSGIDGLAKACCVRTSQKRGHQFH